jgi:hypothetical protein
MISYAEIEEVYFVKPPPPPKLEVSRMFELEGLHFIIVYIIALAFLVISK